MFKRIHMKIVYRIRHHRYGWWCDRKLRVWKKVLKRAKHERENFIDDTMEATEWNKIIKIAEGMVEIYDLDHKYKEL